MVLTQRLYAWWATVLHRGPTLLSRAHRVYIGLSRMHCCKKGCEFMRPVPVTPHCLHFSGFCVDGYCCDTACTASCGTCSKTGSLGICSDVAAGTACAPATCSGSTSFDGNCTGTGFTCGTTSACPGNLACADASVCLTDCAGNSANCAGMLALRTWRVYAEAAHCCKTDNSQYEHYHATLLL
jgi:hypothetical protein